MPEEAIEFESDGQRDSLTGLLAPLRFIEILTHEISLAIREDRALTLISLRLQNFGFTSDHDEARILILATEIREKIRAGDHCARMAEDGFWVLARGEIIAAQIASTRYLDGIEASDWRLRFCEVIRGERCASVLHRMDGLHFGR